MKKQPAPRGKARVCGIPSLQKTTAISPQTPVPLRGRVLSFLLLLLFFCAGWLVRDFNISQSFFDYNLPLAAEQVQETGGMPKEVYQYWVGIRFVQFAERNETQTNLFTYFDDEVGIKVENLTSGVAGYYIGGNEIHVGIPPTNKIIGHEMCHLILFRYNVRDLEANENICYTISENYKFDGVVKNG